jgi:hypothetical protein
MKTFCFVLAAGLCLFSCSNKPDEPLLLPVVESHGQEWATFEGKVRLPNGEVLDVELSLREGSPGVESAYKLNGILLSNQHSSIVQGKGLYEASQLNDGMFGIRLMGAATGHLVSSEGFFTRNIDRMRNAPFASTDYEYTDFYFVTTGDGRLTLTDENYNLIVNDDSFTLFRRSDLFTIEGYFTLGPDCSLEFFERNTFKNWQVARLGVYRDLEDKYVDLAKETWEGIYMRAVAYSVADPSDTSGQHRNLVVKKLVTMGDNR